VGILGAALAGTVLWALAMFGPATTYVHQGTHVPILLAGVLPMAWLAGRGATGAVAAGVLVAVQATLLLVVYLPTDSPGPLDTGALWVAVVGAAACGLGILLRGSSGPARPPSGAPPRPAAPAFPMTAPLPALPPPPAAAAPPSR
jgi:hypothetical protein